MSGQFQEKQELAKDFIRCYLSARQGLTRMGILRSERNPQGDYAEWLTAQLFNLRLAASTVQKGYDAIDSKGRTYQIKSRIVKTLGQNTSFDFSREIPKFDYLMGVSFSPSLDLLGVIRVPYSTVEELCTKNADSFRFRWNRKAAKDPRIKILAWTKKRI